MNQINKDFFAIPKWRKIKEKFEKLNNSNEAETLKESMIINDLIS